MGGQLRTLVHWDGDWCTYDVFGGCNTTYITFLVMLDVQQGLFGRRGFLVSCELVANLTIPRLTEPCAGHFDLERLLVDMVMIGRFERGERYKKVIRF